MIVYDWREIAVWTAVWIVCAVASFVAHEAGHIVVLRHFGWHHSGLRVSWAALGLKNLRHDDDAVAVRSLGPVLIAGPCATLLVTCVFIGLAQLPIDHAWVFGQIAVLNFALFVYNLLPLPITDGGKIVQLVTGWRIRWRYVGLAWFVIEAVGILITIALTGGIQLT